MAGSPMRRAAALNASSTWRRRASPAKKKAAWNSHSKSPSPLTICSHLECGADAHEQSATSGALRRTARHDEVGDHGLDRLSFLVERRRSDPDQSLVRLRPRGPHLRDLTLEPQFVARAQRLWPAELVDASPDYAPCDRERLDHKAHREGG